LIQIITDQVSFQAVQDLERYKLEAHGHRISQRNNANLSFIGNDVGENYFLFFFEN